MGSSIVWFLISIITTACAQIQWPSYGGLQGPPISNDYYANQIGSRLNTGGRNGCDLRSCPCNGKYIPFCGTDGVTYFNICQLKCAQRCDSRLAVKFEGVCAIPYTGVGSKAYENNFAQNSRPRPAQVTTRPLVVVGSYPVREPNYPLQTVTSRYPPPRNPYPESSGGRWPTASYPSTTARYPIREEDRFGNNRRTTTIAPVRYDQWGNRVIVSATTPRYSRYPQNIKNDGGVGSSDWEKKIDWRK